MTDLVKCAVCGKEHSRSQMELSFRRPDDVATLSAEERSTRVRESADLCVLDEQRYFVRTLLPLPVQNRDRPYCIGLWAEVSFDAFNRIRELWDDDAQASEPAFAASLANDVPGVQSTRGLPVKLQLSDPATRPRVFVAEAAHDLHREQSNGITEHRVHEYGNYFS